MSQDPVPDQTEQPVHRTTHVRLRGQRLDGYLPQARRRFRVERHRRPTLAVREGPIATSMSELGQVRA